MRDKMHANLMDGVYRHQRHIYDMTRKYYLLGRDRLIDSLQPPDGGSVLEIGCGTGRNLIAAAKRYPQARFFGLDISETMLSTARRSIAKAGLSDRITLAHGDATSFSPEELFDLSGFDRVFISYSLSMIPAWQSSVENAMTVTKAGGTLHIVDFGGQERLPSWFKVLLYAWLAKFHVTPRLDLTDMLSDLARIRGGHATIQSAYRGYALIGVVGGARSCAAAASATQKTCQQQI